MNRADEMLVAALENFAAGDSSNGAKILTVVSALAKAGQGPSREVWREVHLPEGVPVREEPTGYCTSCRSPIKPGVWIQMRAPGEPPAGGRVDPFDYGLAQLALPTGHATWCPQRFMFPWNEEKP